MKAETKAPIKKITPATNSVKRRPIASATVPATAAPPMQPISTTLIVNSCSFVESAKSLLMNRMAPEITPVS